MEEKGGIGGSVWTHQIFITVRSTQKLRPFTGKLSRDSFRFDLGLHNVQWMTV